MANVRASTARKINPAAQWSDGQPLAALGRQARRAASNNDQWLAAVCEELGQPQTLLVLLGGSSVPDLRLRYAQSILRHDLSPSHWSRVLLLSGRETPKPESQVLGIALDPPQGFGNPRETNAVQHSVRLKHYQNRNRFPNVCAIAIDADFEGLRATALDDLKTDFDVRNMTELLWRWLGYVWGVNEGVNPLREGIGVPDAVLAELVVGAGWGGDLTPGLASRASCAEAIWQTLKWWHELPRPGAVDGDERPYLEGRYRIYQDLSDARIASRQSRQQAAPL